jgi:protoporphyrinogen/coproporphyrinogen III oxidase
VSGVADSVDTLVVGAGIAGLAYAHARGDASLLVLDAAPRAGGLLRTGRAELPGLGALRFEWGPEALQDDAPETLALLGELSLRPVPAAAASAQRFVCWRGRLVSVPLSPGEALRSPLLSASGRMRALTEPWRARAEALDGSVAGFVRHRLGEEVLQRFADPFVTGVYAGDPEQLSVRATFPKLVALVEKHGSLFAGMNARSKERAREPRRGPPGLMTLEGGLGALAEALAARLGARLRLGTRVAALHREGDGWRATLQPVADRDPPPPAELRARRVVVATPVAAAARLLQDAAPALAAELADMTSESLVSISHAWRREQVEHALDGFGYLVPSAEGRGHLGTLFSSSIAPGCTPAGVVLLRTLLGGARRPRVVEWPDEELLAELGEGVAPLLGLTGEPLWAHVVRHRAVLPRYDLRHPQRLERVDELLASTPGLTLLGNWRSGVAVNTQIEAARGAARGAG